MAVPTKQHLVHIAAAFTISRHSLRSQRSILPHEHFLGRALIGSLQDRQVHGRRDNVDVAISSAKSGMSPITWTIALDSNGLDKRISGPAILSKTKNRTTSFKTKNRTTSFSPRSCNGVLL